jgi:hypothetical protein
VDIAIDCEKTSLTSTPLPVLIRPGVSLHQAGTDRAISDLLIGIKNFRNNCGKQSFCLLICGCEVKTYQYLS